MKTRERAHAPRALPSGRSVIVRTDSGREEIEIRSPRGAVEVMITLTDAGPVVRLAGARLELNALETVAINCRRLDVHSEDETRLSSAGAVHINGEELRVQTEQDIHMDGKVIRLNSSRRRP